jgi:DNA-binding NtrC family response regulator
MDWQSFAHFRHVAPRLAQATPSVGNEQRSGALPHSGESHLRTLQQIEEDIICLAISHHRGNMSEIARHLGIGRSTLYRKLDERRLIGLTVDARADRGSMRSIALSSETSTVNPSSA